MRFESAGKHEHAGVVGMIRGVMMAVQMPWRLLRFLAMVVPVPQAAIGLQQHLMARTFGMSHRHGAVTENADRWSEQERRYHEPGNTDATEDPEIPHAHAL
jgi:hypothetical protein